jgi:cytoskeletal protein RodZ
MPTMGEVLRDARLQLDLSIQQAADDTKVRKKYLVALEEDDYPELPAPIYARGFLHIYAEYLGIDPTYASKLYQPPQIAATSSAIRPAASGFRPGAPFSAQAALMVLLTVVVVGAIFYLYSQYLSFESTSPVLATTQRPTELPTLSPSTPAPAIVPIATAAPVPTATPARTPTPVPTPVFGVEVGVRITDRSWLRVVADGASTAVYEGVLEAGATMSWKARDRIDMRVGNAGGVEVTVNGMSQGKLGASGEVKNVTWGRQ